MSHFSGFHSNTEDSEKPNFRKKDSIKENQLGNRDFQSTLLNENSPSEVQEQLKSVKKSFLRSKTSLRMKYEAESLIIKREIGSLEEVRKSLGLSRRKMCQILLIDPSTWTRWTQNEDKVPPFVFRSLQWYLALIDKKPIWHPQNTYQGISFQALNHKRIEILEQKLESTLKKFNHSKKDVYSKRYKLLSFYLIQSRASSLLKWIKLKVKLIYFWIMGFKKR